MDYYFIGWIFIFLLFLFVGFLSQRRWVVWFLMASFVAIVVNQLSFSFFIQWVMFLGLAAIGIALQMGMTYVKNRRE